MGEVKRYGVFTWENGQPDGHYVEYTDCAALKARVAEAESMARLYHTDMMTTLDERDSLRAQLEAAKAEAVNEFRMDELDAVMLSVDKWLDGDELKDNPATRAARAREVALCAIEEAQGHPAQHTAQPDGGTDQLLLRVLSQAIGVRSDCLTLDHSFISAYEDACEWVDAKGYGFSTGTGAVLKADPFDQALAAPAPAPFMVSSFKGTPTDAQAQALKEVEAAGIRHMKSAPAPEPCTCGEAWGKCKCNPAPACKTCGDKGALQTIHIFEAGGHTEVSGEAPTPCPDCAKGEM